MDTSTLARATYSSDASLYRVPPLAVVRPRDVDELLATVAAARETGTPLTMRGAGTSIAGNAVGPGLVVDTSKHLQPDPGIDAEAGTAEVDPGVVQPRCSASRLRTDCASAPTRRRTPAAPSAA